MTSCDVPGGMGLPAEEAHPPKRPVAKDVDANLLQFIRSSHGGDAISRPVLKVLREVKTPEQLAPLTKRRERPTAPNGWEVISAVVDSGATITAVHPQDAAAYPVLEGEASRRGVTYGTAGSEDLPNLGEKLCAVLTAEGTLRGFQS